MIENLLPYINIAVGFLFKAPKYSVIPVNFICFLKIALFIGKVIRSYFVEFAKLLQTFIWFNKFRYFFYYIQKMKYLPVGIDVGIETNSENVKNYMTNVHSNRAQITCFRCGEQGHYKSECFHWKTRTCWHFLNYD